MYEATKLRIEDAMHIGWDIITCKITSCKATRTDAGHKSTISGYVVMSVRSVRIRFRWKACQVTSSMPLTVEQDYLCLPEIDGALLVGNNGRKADFEASLKMAQAVINKHKGKWEAKVKHVVRLSRW